MAKKNGNVMLAKELVIGDAIELKPEFNDFTIVDIEESDVASVDQQSVLTVECNQGPYKGRTGKFMIRPDDNLTVLRKGPRPSRWKRFKRFLLWGNRKPIANDNPKPNAVVVATFKQ